MWASLNEEGKKVWGDVFPDGKVPVLSFNFQNVKLEPQKHQRGKTERVIMVNLMKLNKLQQDTILKRLIEKTGANEQEIKFCLKKYGLPIRERYTTGSVTAELRYFI